MPGNLISSLVNFLASHLIVICLLGFVLSGLRVFGVWSAEETVHSAQVRPSAPVAPVPPAAPGPKLQKTPGTKTPEALSAEGGMQSRSANTPADLPTAPKTPRLIGGSLPIYPQNRPEPVVPSQALASEGVFRPPLAAEPVTPLTRDELVQQARRAFWNGDFEGAEAIYMDVIAQQPGDADAFGELGNLYQSMGKPGQALDAFFEAGVRLKALGETEKLKIIIALLEKEGDSRWQQLSP